MKQNEWFDRMEEGEVDASQIKNILADWLEDREELLTAVAKLEILYCNFLDYHRFLSEVDQAMREDLGWVSNQGVSAILKEAREVSFLDINKVRSAILVKLADKKEKAT